MNVSWVNGLDFQQANLDIWDIDESYAPHRQILQKAYNDAAIMAAKALKDIEFVQQPRPLQDGKLQERMEWDRIARAVNNMFGFMPNEGGTDPEANEYLEKVIGETSTIAFIYTRH